MTVAFVERTPSGRWRWRLHDSHDGQLKESSVAYERRRDCVRGFHRWQRKIARARVAGPKERRT